MQRINPIPTERLITTASPATSTRMQILSCFNRSDCEGYNELIQRFKNPSHQFTPSTLETLKEARILNDEGDISDVYQQTLTYLFNRYVPERRN